MLIPMSIYVVLVNNYTNCVPSRHSTNFAPLLLVVLLRLLRSIDGKLVTDEGYGTNG